MQATRGKGRVVGDWGLDVRIYLDAGWREEVLEDSRGKR